MYSGYDLSLCEDQMHFLAIYSSPIMKRKRYWNERYININLSLVSQNLSFLWKFPENHYEDVLHDKFVVINIQELHLRTWPLLSNGVIY